MLPPHTATVAKILSEIYPAKVVPFTSYCITTPRTILENLLTLLALRILDNTGEHELNFRPVQTPLWKRRSRRRVKKLLRMFTMILH